MPDDDTLKGKTIVFHSYKGGVGRTSSLINTAISLTKVGKKVGILDLDLDAPGIALKLDKESDIKSGFVDYLMEFSSYVRSGKGTSQDDENSLAAYIKQSLIDVRIDNGNHISFLTPGSVFDKKYFLNINSNRLLSKFDIEIDVGGYLSDNSDIRSLENWTALVSDKDRIMRAMGDVDYLLVDCRSAHQFASATVLAWADTVIELFPCNAEGYFGYFLMQGLIDENRFALGRKIEVFPVVSRTPADQIGSLELVFQEMKNRFSDFFGDFLSEIAVPTLTLSEQRQIEVGSGLFLMSDDEVVSEYNISYEYVNLFLEVFPGLQREEWLLKLGLEEEKRKFEKVFDYWKSQGSLLNYNKDENVALRRSTAAGLVNSIAQQQLNALGSKEQVDRVVSAIHDPALQQKLVEEGFHMAGLQAGRAFGAHASDGHVWPKMPSSALKRLMDWCAFDREVGFGDWNLCLDEDEKGGLLRISNHFLEGANRSPDGIDTFMGDQFICGYAQGVISFLISPVLNDVGAGVVKDRLVVDPVCEAPICLSVTSNRKPKGLFEIRFEMEEVND